MVEEISIFKKIDKAKDKLFKMLFHSMGDLVFKRFGIDEKIKEVYPTEIISSEFKNLMMDMVFKTYDDNMVIVEFHSGDVKDRNLRKYFQYGANLLDKSKLPVNIYVISTGEKEKSLEEIITINGYTFAPQTIFFKNMDGDRELKKLEEKIRKNEKIDFKTLSNLVFIPFMKTKKSTEYLVEKVCDLTNKIKNIPENEKLLIKNSQILLLYIFIKDKEKHDNLLQVIKMQNDFLGEYLEREILQGLEQGKAQGRKEILNKVENLINEGRSTSEIKTILQL